MRGRKVRKLLETLPFRPSSTLSWPSSMTQPLESVLGPLRAGRPSRAGQQDDGQPPGGPCPHDYSDGDPCFPEGSVCWDALSVLGDSCKSSPDPTAY